MASSIPEELVVEIMSWLPPEKLVQSKIVSKHWNSLITSLINDNAFVSKHLRNSNDNASVALTCLRAFQATTPARKQYRELFSLITLSDSGAAGKISSVTELLNLPIIPGEKDMSSVTASHCNGLICLADYYHNVVVLNPALNVSRTVPRPGLVDRFLLQGVGFGHDSAADDYKVVRFGRDAATGSHRAEVYSLRSDTWREIVGADLGSTDQFPSLNVELGLDGRFYWLMVSGPRYEVRCFDMRDEAFTSVAVPESVRVARADWASLGAWEESVALMLCFVGEVEVWAMEEEEEGWRKRASVGPAEGIDCPLAFWNREELLVRGSTLKDLLSYNVRTREFRNVGVDGLDGIGSRAFSYVRSLVSV